MKLVLANNQSEKFKNFYDSLKLDGVEIDYSDYKSQLFVFNTSKSEARTTFINVNNGKQAQDFSGVYINGYLNTYELAASTAIALEGLGVPFVNQELANAPSLSKLSSYAKLANAGVTMPLSYGGTTYAIQLGLKNNYISLNYPAILKRADADRGIDNYKVTSTKQVNEILSNEADMSLWILQSFIPNDGFYLTSIYHGKPRFVIFRSLHERPDGNQLKAHMFKPKGGSNASLIPVEEAPKSLIDTSLNAVRAMNRQIASVDSIYDKNTDTTYVLEVNYNPQLVTIDTFRQERLQAFIDAMNEL